MTPNFFSGYDRIDNPSKINIHNYTDRFFNNYEYVVIWFGRISRGSNRQNAVKLIEVRFLSISDGYVVDINIPIELALKLTIGSIWVNGVTHEKFDFDDMFTSIEEYSSNLSYSNHFGISQDGGKYEFDLNSYPVGGLATDTNTLLVIKQGTQKVIIHPIIFYMAHYGISKEINRILLTYLWVDVEDKLNLNHPDPKISDIIVIPNDCVIADGVFLHYLKHDEYTKSVTKDMNKRVLDKLIKDQKSSDPLKKSKVPSAPLKVVPYHEQEIEIGFKGIEIESGVILCTEITGMSMPQGDAINYAFSEYADKENNLNQNERLTRSYKPLFNKIDVNEVVVEAESNAGNSTTAIVRQHIQTIGEMRKLAKVDNITIDQVIRRQNSQVIPLNEPIPSTYAVGSKSGTNKDVGILRSLIDSEVVEYRNPIFKKLLEYAQSLRADLEYPQYNDMLIDCYSRGHLYGETTEYLNRHDEPSNVLSIYVLKIVANTGTYYIFDSCVVTGISTSGIGIKVDNEDQFENTGVNAVLEELFTNNGRLSDQDELEVTYGLIVKFNHVRSKNSNWVKTVLEKLNNPSIEDLS
ncbi:MAG: hypothetical protein ACTHU5_04755 [Psychrobacter sp.]|uniref:hypothetical protein n=1 Tax=Psychrobacter sp. TaxID=56811 RepID=UPI003F96DE5B